MFEWVIAKGMSLAMQVAAERTTRSKSARGAPPWKPSTDPPRTFQKHLHQLQYGLPPFRSQRDMSRKLGRKAQEMFLEGIRTQKKIRAQQKEQIEKEKTGEWRLQKAKEVANPTQACNAPWKNADSVPRVFNKFETVEGADSEVRWQERQVELGLMRPRASSAPPGRSFRLNTPYWKEKKTWQRCGLETQNSSYTQSPKLLWRRQCSACRLVLPIYSHNLNCNW